MHTRFEIEPDYADALRAAGLADFDALFNAPAGPPTSKHRHRETVPIEFDVNGRRQRFFLKRVFKVPAQHAWRPWLRGKPGYSQPAREWDAIKMMRDAGLPVMKRVALGERRKFSIPTQALILVEDVGMQWTLENWLIPGFPKPPEANLDLSSSLWWELGRIRGTMDAHGLVWPDISAKHIYAEAHLQEDSRIQWRFGLIDVERVAHRPSITRRAQKAHRQVHEFLSTCAELREPWRQWLIGPLADRLWQPLLDSVRPTMQSAASRAAFEGGYSHEIQLAMGVATPFKVLLEAATPFEVLVDDNQGQIAPLNLPGDFVHPRSHAIRHVAGVAAADDHRDTLIKAGITNFDTAFALGHAQTLSKPGLQNYRDRMRQVLDAGSPQESVLYVKRYRRPPWTEQLRRMIEAQRDHSTGYREFKTARRLLEIGIPSAVPIAYGERMRGWIEDASFVVFREVRGESLETLAGRWKNDLSSLPSWAERVEITRRLGHLVGRLHAEGWFHRDLYFSHVFLSRNADGKIVLQLIDLARMIRRAGWRRHFRGRWRVKDLSALAYSAPWGLVTRADRMRFLKSIGYHYFRVYRKRSVNMLYRKATRWAFRWLLDDINSRVAKMGKHDARRAARFARQRESSSSAPAEGGRYP